MCKDPEPRNNLASLLSILGGPKEARMRGRGRAWEGVKEKLPSSSVLDLNILVLKDTTDKVMELNSRKSRV